MKIEIINYSKIRSNYRLTQPVWLKVIVIMVAIATLMLSVHLLSRFQPSNVIVVCLLIVAVIFGVGFTKQISNTGIWSALLSNDQAIYIIASADGKKFMQLPRRFLIGIKLGIHGLNSRGLIINIKPSLISDNELDVLRGCLNITEDNASQISISVPTGIVNRKNAIHKLECNC